MGPVPIRYVSGITKSIFLKTINGLGAMAITIPSSMAEFRVTFVSTAIELLPYAPVPISGT